MLTLGVNCTLDVLNVDFDLNVGFNEFIPMLLFPCTFSNDLVILLY